MPRMTPSEAFVETLVAHGVKHVFGIVGSAYMDALDLFPPAGIRFISVAHEQGAGHMADGYSRVSNRQGVCIAQNGPGITNFVTAVAAAYWAHSPVVVITPETGSATQGKPEARALAEYLSARVVRSSLHNDAFPASHPLMCGSLGYRGSKAAMKLIARADVVLALGTRLGPFGTLPQHGIEYWPKNARIIQVDSDHRMLGLVKPITVGVCGDAKPAAADMLHRLQTGNVKISAHGNKDARLAELEKQKDAWEAELNTWGQADGSPIAPRRALRELEKAMPKNAMVTTDIGNICSVSNSYLRFEQPRSFFAAMSFGNCGYAFPTAIGAKVAAPDRPALAYVRDGAWGMSLHETLTCVR